MTVAALGSLIGLAEESRATNRRVARAVTRVKAMPREYVGLVSELLAHTAGLPRELRRNWREL